MRKSSDTAGCTVSREAMYRWIYALPKGELSNKGILPQSNRTKLRSVKPLGERRGGLILCDGGKSAVADLAISHVNDLPALT